MYIREFVKLHNLSSHGLLHVGAHEAEEHDEYVNSGLARVNPIIWVEAQRELAERLKNRLDPQSNKVYCGVAWDKDDEKLEFNITSKTASSSVYQLGDHKKMYPDIEVVEKLEVRTSRLDSLLKKDDIFDFVVLDIQGAEGKALVGLGHRIKSVNWIFTEVSKRELYTGAMQFRELDSFLTDLGFKRVFTAWDRRAGWGDALYARDSIYEVSSIQRIEIYLSKARRVVRSYTPNSVFPFLVNCKKFFKKYT